jgi:histidine ammonia-lyase
MAMMLLLVVLCKALVHPVLCEVVSVGHVDLTPLAHSLLRRG